MTKAPIEIEKYISSFSPEISERLQKIRSAILQVAPNPSEKISYAIASVKATLGAKSYTIYYGAWKNHIGFYPVFELDKELEAKVAAYRSGKDSLKFPNSQEIPYRLISELSEKILKTKGLISD